MSFCPSCVKCPQCCVRSGCRGQTTEVLANLAQVGSKSQGGLDFARGIHATLQNQTTFVKDPGYSERLCSPHKKQGLSKCSVRTARQIGGRKSASQILPGVLQPSPVPKPTNRWRPILDLSQLNLFLHPGTFKMETPETIRLSLQKGEWVTSLDFSNAYFHIPINQRSRKYLRFSQGKKVYQFTALPFGLATAPLEFTKVVKEVKLMAQARGIQIHQYLDDWLVRAPCHRTCLLHTQTLLALCRDLGWLVNMTKSELTPQQVFNFVGYRFDLLSGRVLPTQDSGTPYDRN